MKSRRDQVALVVFLAAALAVSGALAQEIDEVEGPVAPDEPEAEVEEMAPEAEDQPVALGEEAPGLVDTTGRDMALEARALELAGFRALAVVVITSEPDGADVTVGGETSCVTPCRLSLPPGRYRFWFSHEKLEPVEVTADVTTAEQLQVHAELGQETPWGFILPTYLVGGIFTAGGISALALYGHRTDPRDVGESDVPADQRRFTRNLGIASLSVGVPLIFMATYLLITGGKPGEARTSVAPQTPELALGPTLDPHGRPFGAGIVGTF
jgi:hypothetical protein